MAYIDYCAIAFFTASTPAADRLGILRVVQFDSDDSPHAPPLLARSASSCACAAESAARSESISWWPMLLRGLAIGPVVGFSLDGGVGVSDRAPAASEAIEAVADVVRPTCDGAVRHRALSAQLRPAGAVPTNAGEC